MNNESKKNIISSVLTTLSFYDLFEFPLTNMEIYDNLWGVKCGLNECLKAIDTLREENKLYFADGFYCLSGRGELVDIRKKRYLFSYHKWRMIEKHLWVFRLVPFIKMVGVSNTLGFSNAKENGDIDLLVITKKDRLFTTRLILTFWMLILGKWRHGKNVANRFCLSFYVTENYINFRKLLIDENDIYLMYWLKWLRPIYGTDMKVAENFWRKNKWVEKFIPNTKMINPLLNTDKPNCWGKLGEIILSGWLGDLIEIFLEKSQLMKIKKKTPADNIDGAMASKNILKFHPEGKRGEYAGKWLEMVRKID